MHVIHDADRVDPLPDWLFAPEALDRRSLIDTTGHGRRQVWFFRFAGMSLVLRHYWRGGAIARLSDDAYLWTGLARSRPFREYRLLAELHALGLPVPRPLAARVQVSGLTYQGDLITAAVPQAAPFDDILRGGQVVDDRLWHRVGCLIGRFHAVGACHADLNVRNILVDRTGHPWLIDWDRGRLRHPDWRWQNARLARLRHSLRRQPDLDRAARAGWPALLAGHEEGLAWQDADCMDA